MHLLPDPQAVPGGPADSSHGHCLYHQWPHEYPKCLLNQTVPNELEFSQPLPAWRLALCSLLSGAFSSSEGFIPAETQAAVSCLSPFTKSHPPRLLPASWPYKGPLPPLHRGSQRGPSLCLHCQPQPSLGMSSNPALFSVVQGPAQWLLLTALSQPSGIGLSGVGPSKLFILASSSDGSGAC